VVSLRLPQLRKNRAKEIDVVDNLFALVLQRIGERLIYGRERGVQLIQLILAR
jgi:hypothetical protein